METVLNGRDKEKIHAHWEFSTGKNKMISDDRTNPWPVSVGAAKAFETKT